MVLDPLPADEGDLSTLSRRIGRTVRADRLALGWSLGDLARASGLSKTILARIERGDGNPSVETLWRVSQALSVPLGRLLAGEHQPRTRLIRARAGEPIRSDAGMAAWLLHGDGREHRTEAFAIDLPKGVDQHSEAHLPGTEELIVCVKGRVRVGPVGEEVELGPGDAAWFTADLEHHYEALRDTQTLCFMLYAPGRAGGGVP
jgi:transcriptional regulator with XRE-family HTH domain